MLIIGAGSISFGVIGLWQKYKTTHNPNPIISNQIITFSTDNPDETPPKCDSYIVAALQPRKISLPTISSDGCIQKVGIDQHKSVAAPDNIHLAGWYTYSETPGNKGVSLIDGHVSGKYQSGIFKDLMNLKTGDRFSIEFGNYTTRQFEVVNVASTSVNEATKQMLVKRQDIENQLNLITCGGRFDRQSQQYDRRVLVVSKRVG